MKTPLVRAKIQAAVVSVALLVLALAGWHAWQTGEARRNGLSSLQHFQTVSSSDPSHLPELTVLCRWCCRATLRLSSMSGLRLSPTLESDLAVDVSKNDRSDPLDASMILQIARQLRPQATIQAVQLNNSLPVRFEFTCSASGGASANYTYSWDFNGDVKNLGASSEALIRTTRAATAPCVSDDSHPHSPA